MARWKLTEPHYLNCPHQRWELATTDVNTGRPTRKVFRVPLHLDPRVADDWNFKPANNAMDGEIHVCLVGKGHSGDIEFEGDPTPGMLPLDDEAREISGKFDWKPTQGIDEESQRASFYSKLTDKLFLEMQDVKAAAAIAPPAPGLDKFLEAMMAMMGQNQQILSALAGKVQKLDEEEPLPQVEVTEEELAEAAAAAAKADTASRTRAQQHVMSKRI